MDSFVARWVVVYLNNECADPATLHDDFDFARASVRRTLSDVEPPLTEEERIRMEEGLAMALPDCQNEILGSDAWKERAIIAPLER
jgi:hypothetical protein